MGLFSGISSALFGDPGKDIGRARDESLGFQREGLDYLKEIDALPLELRNQVLPMLSGYFMGDPATRQEFVNRAKSDPFYNEMIKAGQEGVLSQAGAMGLTRSGNVAEDLSQSNQNVLQGLVQQQLQGMQGFANPNLNSPQIASIYGGMGDTAAQAGIAQANANQGIMGQLFSGISGGLSAAANLGWNPFGATSGNTLPGPAGANVGDYTGTDYQNWLAGQGG